MAKNRMALAGIEFEAVRRKEPKAHWALKSLANGQVYPSVYVGSVSRAGLQVVLEQTLKVMGERLFRASFGFTSAQYKALLASIAEAEVTKVVNLPRVPASESYTREWDDNSKSGFIIRRIKATQGCREHFEAKEWRCGEAIDFITGTHAKCEVWVDYGIERHHEWRAEALAPDASIELADDRGVAPSL